MGSVGLHHSIHRFDGKTLLHTVKIELVANVIIVLLVNPLKCCIIAAIFLFLAGGTECAGISLSLGVTILDLHTSMQILAAF